MTNFTIVDALRGIAELTPPFAVEIAISYLEKTTNMSQDEIYKAVSPIDSSHLPPASRWMMGFMWTYQHYYVDKEYETFAHDMCALKIRYAEKLRKAKFLRYMEKYVVEKKEK